MTPSLTTVAACRVAGIHRDRFNEFVAAGAYRCAPSTTAGRARTFAPDDILGISIFRDLMADGMTAAAAGEIACAVAEAAKANPQALAISYVRTWQTATGWTLDGTAHPTDELPAPAEWNSAGERKETITRMMTFNVSLLRDLIAKRIEKERPIIGGEG
ncbi:hypothetical protein ABB55_27300 [Prosthecomicrobium hirschii]|uniref:HTH merR-type domain-containing protein n=1 Tax=Prosthecodimorpha hirschii TaxID=665126 RepID=A0A0P6VVS5_9HYPH|nr:hypothetical protein [Prosthecomicrobium hirschii]KPL55486.1 hypothetical protein ABB55_27300 [Prosthecomicrobium hirschii]